MIVFPRFVARSCRAVFKRLLPRGRQLARSAAVGLSAGPDGLRFRCAAEEVAVEFLHPGPAAEVRLTVPLEALAECEGRTGEVAVIPLDAERCEVRWSQDGAARSRTHAWHGRAVPDFPAWPETFTESDPELLAALDRAVQTAATEGIRYALHRLQLRGTKGQVVASDGRQLLLEGGFRFPWDEDLLVARTTIFGAAELRSGDPVRVARSGGHVLFRVGFWTVALKVIEGERFPAVDAVLPNEPAGTVWRLGPGEGAALVRLLPTLPGAEEDQGPVTVDLGRASCVRAKAPGQTRPTEAALASSTVQGKAVRFATARRYLARAVKLGFDAFEVSGGGKPVVCRAGPRTYVWMNLDPQDAVPPHPHPLRVPLLGPAEKYPGATGLPPRPPLGRPAQQPTGSPPASAPNGAGQQPVGWLGRLARWSAGVRRLAGLVAEQRRREGSG
jgi:hypothetical protein